MCIFNQRLSETLRSHLMRGSPLFKGALKESESYEDSAGKYMEAHFCQCNENIMLLVTMINFLEIMIYNI